MWLIIICSQDGTYNKGKQLMYNFYEGLVGKRCPCTYKYAFQKAEKGVTDDTREKLYKTCLPGKSVPKHYFQSEMTFRRPCLSLRISFPGRPIFIQFVPGWTASQTWTRWSPRTCAPEDNEKYSVAGKIRLRVHVQSSPCCCRHLMLKLLQICPLKRTTDGD